MSFAETYAHEVIETRRIRAQRARFWAKLISILLMITIAAVLRSEPQLRAALMGKAVDGVMALRDTSSPHQGNPVVPGQLPGTAMADPEAVRSMLQKIQSGQVVGSDQNTGDPTISQSPGFLTRTPLPPNHEGPVGAPSSRTGIKINRPGGHSGPRFERVTPPSIKSGSAQEAQSLTNQISKTIGDR